MKSLKTEINVDNAFFVISTNGQSGRGASCSVVQATKTGSGFSYDLFGGWRKTLASTPAARVTDKLIEDTHAAGLVEFERMKQAGELPKEKTNGVITRGMILWTEGIGSRRHRVVYEVVQNEFGTNYKTVEVEQPHALSTDSHVKHIDNKFGIGVYHKAEMFDRMDELDAMVEAGKQHAIDSARAKQMEQEAKDKARNEAIDKGRQIVRDSIGENIPPYAIVGFYNESETRMDDYTETHTTNYVVLGWSHNKANVVSELVAACKNFEGTKHLTEADKDTHTYSSRVFIGSKYRGWQVQKMATEGSNLTAIYEYAAKNYAAPRPSISSATENSGTTSVDGTRIVHNESKGGVEIYFKGKPAQHVLDSLKSAGFRWSRFNSCWYARVSDRTIAEASKYGTVPSSASHVEDGHDNMIIDQIAERINA